MSSSYSLKNNNTATNDFLLGKICLSLLPLVSFLAQYMYSKKAGTIDIFFQHKTVMIVDWIFVPFNFFVVSVIDWKKGSRIFIILIISVVLNIVTHAFWQYNNLDLGHMITNTQIVLPAGWVHLGFSIIETVLLFSFVFCRKISAAQTLAGTISATIYFITMGVCGYIMHHKVILSDAVVVSCGLFFILIYPKLIGGKAQTILTKQE